MLAHVVLPNRFSVIITERGSLVLELNDSLFSKLTSNPVEIQQRLPLILTALFWSSTQGCGSTSGDNKMPRCEWMHRSYWKEKSNKKQAPPSLALPLSTSIEDVSNKALLPAPESARLATATASTKSQAVETPSVKFKPFGVSKLDLDNRLSRATKELLEASNALQATLDMRTNKESDAAPDFLACLQDHERSPPLPFSTAIRATLAKQEARKQAWTSQIADFLATLYPTMKLVLDLAGTAASYAGFSPLEITANGLLYVFDIIKTPRALDADIVEGLDELTRDEKFIVKLKRFAVQDLDEDLKVDTTELMTALNLFLNDSIRFLNHHYAVKLLKGIAGTERVGTSKDRLAKARERLTKAVAQRADLLIMSRELDKTQQDVLDKICSVQENTTHINKQRALHLKRIDNTAAWFLSDQRFIDWRDNLKSGVMWCSGLPGAGKTFVASAIIDNVQDSFQDRGIGFAYIFSERSGQSQADSYDRKAERAFRSLVRQILEQRPPLIHEISRFIEKRYFGLGECYTILNKVADNFKHLAIVLDALDEFSNDHSERWKFAKELAKLQDSVDFRLKVLITTREMDDIQKLLQPSKRLPIRASRTDIEGLVTMIFNDSWFSEDSILRAEVVKEIADKSDLMSVALQQAHNIHN